MAMKPCRSDLDSCAEWRFRAFVFVTTLGFFTTIFGGALATAQTNEGQDQAASLRDEIYYRLVEPCLPHLARHMYESDDLPLGFGMSLAMAIEMLLDEGTKKMAAMSEQQRVTHYAEAVADCQSESLAERPR